MLRFQSLYGRTDNTLVHLRHKYLIRKRNRGNGSHATGIQARIALADTLIIFRYRKHLVIVAIRQDEYGAFDTIQELLDHDRLARVAKHSAQHISQLFLGFLQVIDNQYPFTGSQSIRFQYIRSGKRFQERIAFL